MCGIAGLFAQTSSGRGERIIRWMTDRLIHRGPDSGGTYCDPRLGWYLGFRRLAIRDLDPRANQPMVSRCGRTVLVFNGEIYNATEIAEKYLSGVCLRTTGDTEVLLEAFERRGPQLLPELNGMFAFAALDTHTGRLTLARDRWGKKPLFVLERPGLLAFASELRSLQIFDLEADPEQLPYYFHFGYFPPPATFYRDVTQLCPGEWAIFENGRITHRCRYFAPWDLPWGTETRCDYDRLAALLIDAVRIRTISDVPIGAFLSGGIDSSLVAACLQKAEARDVPTFTVGFSDKRIDEAAHAAAIAGRLGLRHKVLSVDERDLTELVLDFVDCYEQPYMDKSGVAAMVLCESVRPFATVALSGDGGDEFFGGYDRYRWFTVALKCLRWPMIARRPIGRVAQACFARRGRRIREWLAARDPAALYAAIVRNWLAGPLDRLMPQLGDAIERPITLVRDVFDRVKAAPVLKAGCFDAAYYIPGDLQVKIDRASMRVGLEVRCPLLDPRVAEFGARLSPKVKFAGGLKSALKRVLGEYVHRPLWDRPKQGFSVPMTSWLRGPLRPVLHDTLNADTFRSCDWLDRRVVESTVLDFLAGADELNGSVWMLFILARHMLTDRPPAKRSALLDESLIRAA